MGALRLGRTVSGPFLNDREPLIPPITRLHTLEAAARAFEDDPRHPIEDAQLALLIAPGSSLGGARPKANFRDVDGRLWIAKFPSRTDRQDSAAWEYIYSRLAARAGIHVPESRLLDLGGAARTFCTLRFDRDGAVRRLYTSAMTMTGKHDGDTASYVDIATAIRTHGAPAFIGEDLRQLFRRLVFNVVSGNRDDHLRNHGFVRTSAGWRLAPAFDMNPGRAQRQHAISPDGHGFGPDVPAAVATHRVYGLTAGETLTIVREVVEAVSDWRTETGAVGVSRHEQDVVGESWVALADARALIA
jgi:serine/threonine-protein kinase HipA